MDKEEKELLKNIQAYISKSHSDMLVTDIDADGVLHIDVYGECASCPGNCMSAEGELSQGILKQFNEVKRVSLTPAISEETINFAKKLLGIVHD